MNYKILIINPGASSTKIALYENEKSVFQDNIKHNYEKLKELKNIAENKSYRAEKILALFKEKNLDLTNLSAISAMGGLLKPLKSGTYRINNEMLKDLEEAKRGYHASNLGALIAYEIGSKMGIPSFIVDPVSVDEFTTIARYSGSKYLQRECLSHALNTKAVAKRWAKEHNKKYASINLIVVHLGSGITVSAHKNGEMIDATNSMEEGAFSVERSGTIPCMKLTKLCFSGQYNQEQVQKMIFGEGGIYSYLGLKDFKEVMDKVHSADTYAKEVVDAMIYQIAKEIGAMATVLQGKMDSIIITGGMAHDAYLIDNLKQRISFLSPLYIYPGEDELQALAEGALRILRGEESSLEY